MSTVLLTGGTGFIGSHTAVELLNKGHNVILADNLYNSVSSVVDRIASITGKRPLFYQADVRDKAALREIFAAHTIDAVIHFAGYKAVGESVQLPVAYYSNNLETVLSVLEVMQAYGCKRMIFSSSATVYGRSERIPFTETDPGLGSTNPYGWTKCMIEQILKDVSFADPTLSVVILRYFNPIGAHESGLIGEKPNGIPNNLMPYITQVAAGLRDHLQVFGQDYPTPDGTGVRDYIHVVDLALGHVAALQYSLKHDGCEIFNLGTGRGYSVLDLVRAFERATGVRIPYEIAARRPGDIAVCYAATDKAEKMLGWRAERSLADMCRDSWRWQQSEWAKER